MDAFLMQEGFLIDDAGHMIASTYVDLRHPAERIPITTLVKACEKRFAIEDYKRIRISKPGRFREFGENLIRDDGEGYASRTTIVAERVDAQEDLAKARLLDEERNRASELVGSGAKTNTNSVRRSRTSSRWLTFGKNRWIFCTSIEPTSPEEEDIWWKTMPGEYDHISHIHRPREFARALGSMVAEQLGPQGKEEEMKHSFDRELKLITGHKTQMLLHGPVAYVDDPFATISRAHDNWSFLARTSFVKDVKYRDQREYRFVVLSEEDPSRETEDLVVTSAMLGAMERRSGESARRAFPAIVWDKDSPDAARMIAGQEYETVAEESEQGEDLPLPELATTPPMFPDWRGDSVPITPSNYDASDLPEDYEEMTTTYAAVQTLRSSIGGPFGRQEPAAASSAWHIEPCIRHLCAVFDDPIRNVRVTEDDFVVVTLNFPKESKAEGRVAVGPHGTASYHVKTDQGATSSINQAAWRAAVRIEEVLRDAGLAVRQKPAAKMPKISAESG